MKKGLPEPERLWGSRGLEPGFPKSSVTSIIPFLLSSHFYLCYVMASFSPADRFSLHGEEHGPCPFISSMESVPPLSCLGGGALIGLPWATCIPGGPIKGYGAMTGPTGVAGPTLWPGGQG